MNKMQIGHDIGGNWVATRPRSITIVGINISSVSMTFLVRAENISIFENIELESIASIVFECCQLLNPAGSNIIMAVKNRIVKPCNNLFLANSYFEYSKSFLRYD